MNKVRYFTLICGLKGNIDIWQIVLDNPLLSSSDDDDDDCFDSYIVLFSFDSSLPFFCSWLNTVLSYGTNTETSFIGNNKYQDTFLCILLLLLSYLRHLFLIYNATTFRVSALLLIDGKICAHRFYSCELINTLMLYFDPHPSPKMLFQGDTPEGSDTFQWTVIERDRVGGLRLMIWDKVKVPLCHYSDALEESNLWTAWQLFPLDDD